MEKEYMKMAMLKHEETFKQQVYELHRLYQIQIILMKSIEEQRRDRRGQIHHKARTGLDLEQQPADEYIAESDGELEVEDESEIQLTLGPASYYKRKKKAETETPPTSDSGHSFSSSSSGSSHKMKMTREELAGRKWGITMVPADSNAGAQSGRKNSNLTVEEKLNQDRLKQINPWLFQTLSLNLT